MSRATFAFSLAVTMIFLGTSSQPLFAAHGHGSHCQSCGTACGSHRLVKKTVMVPMIITEQRLKTRIVKNTELREETYTVFKKVPVTKTYTKEKCYLADDVKTQMITEKECHRIQRPVIEICPVKVPHEEFRTTVVQKEVCTECGPVCVEEECTHKVNVEHEEMQAKTNCVTDVVFTNTKKEITYCVKVPKTQKKVCEVETYELVPVEKTRMVEVCVPQVIKQPVEVQVKKMVRKTILCCEKCRKHHARGLFD